MADVNKGSNMEKIEGDKPEIKVEPEVKAAVEKINEEKSAPKAAAPKTNKKPAAKRAPAKKIKAKAPAAKKAAPKPAKKETTMTKMDVNNIFAAFELPNADKIEEMVAEAGKKGEEFIAKSKSATEELAELSKANIEAIVESGKIATAGVKKLGEELVEDSRDGFEKASEAMKAFAEAKTPAEVLELQAKYLRSTFDNVVSETAAMTEQWVKLAGDAMQPVSNRASLNAEKIKSLMA